MKIVGRGIQFLLTGICLLIKFIINILLKLYIFFIGGIILIALVDISIWKMVLKFLFLGFQIFMAGFLVDFVNNWIGKIFGSILNEEEEDKNIFENYKKQFFYQYKRNEYNSEQSNYSKYSENSGYSKYSGYKEKKYENYSRTQNDIVKKYEEYLKYFGINTEMKITLEIIKKAYKIKIKEVHPDKNPGKDTTEETAKVNEIREFLDMNLEYYLMKRGF